MTNKELEAAVVQLPKLEGRGILVPGGLVMTAAHCLEYDSSKGAGLALGDNWKVEVTTHDGTEMLASPYFIEAFADIAVLGAMDAQSVSDKRCDAFDTFVEDTSPIHLWKPGPLCKEPRAELHLPIKTMSLSDGWTDGQAVVMGAGNVSVFTRRHLEGGTSGGPILTLNGELVGLISSSEDSPGETAGDCGMPEAWADMFGPSMVWLAAYNIPPRIMDMMDVETDVPA